MKYDKCKEREVGTSQMRSKSQISDKQVSNVLT